MRPGRYVLLPSSRGLRLAMSGLLVGAAVSVVGAVGLPVSAASQRTMVFVTSSAASVCAQWTTPGIVTSVRSFSRHFKHIASSSGGMLGSICRKGRGGFRKGLL